MKRQCIRVGMVALLAGSLAGFSGTAWSQEARGGAGQATEGARGGRGGGRGGGGGAQSADYPFPYRAVTPEQIAEVMNRVYAYIDANTASRVISRQTGEPITDFAGGPNPDAGTEPAQYQIVSYEWGVVYNGMVEAAAATGDPKYKDYVDKRLNVIANLLKVAPPLPARGGGGGGGGGRGQGGGGAAAGEGARGERGGGRGGGRGFGGGGRGGINFRSMLAPGSLDDSGSMCAGMIKSRLAGIGPDLLPQIERYINWIHTGQFRFPDGTLARNRPLPNTLWLDDLYMSVPALAWMGKLTGDTKYYDDAAKQVIQFAERMFNKEKGLFAHGWTMSAQEHPSFYWGRANGWAIVAITELLEVLPENHPQRAAVMNIYKAHLKGLAQLQSGDGLWHQVLDRNNSYLETSCTAMFTYAFARGINKGWLDPVTYGPVTMLAWNGLAPKVNEQGQVEGTCVATDLAFDYAFYHYRPVSATAPHGYGPLLLAGAEMTRLVKNRVYRVNFQALHDYGPAQANP